MSSDFDSKMTTAGDAIFAAFGESLTYTDSDDVETVLTGSFAPQPSDTRPVTDGETRIRQAIATVLISDLASPALGETITHNSELWAVEAYHRVHGGTAWEIRLTRSEIEERSRQAYRLRR